MFETSCSITGHVYNSIYSCVKLTQRQYNMKIAVLSANVPHNLRQYYADLLMLKLLEEGRI